MRRVLALGAAALALAALSSLVSWSGGPVELIHEGALTQMEDERAAASVEGRSAAGSATRQLHRGMFVESSGEGWGGRLPARVGRRHYGERIKEAQHFRHERSAQQRTIAHLTNRDVGQQRAADAGASKLLDSYSKSFGISEYEATARDIDAKSAHAFLRRPYQRPPKAASSAHGGEGGQAGEHEFGAPPDTATHDKGGALKGASKLPAYVLRAARDLEGASYVRTAVDSPVDEEGRAKATMGEGEDANERMARAPLRDLPKGSTVSELVKRAVGSALKQASAGGGGSRGSSPRSSPQARTSYLYQLDNKVGYQGGGRGQPAAHARQQQLMSSSVAAAAEPESAEDARKAFEAQERHLEEEMAAIYGSPTAPPAPTHATQEAREPSFKEQPTAGAAVSQGSKGSKDSKGAAYVRRLARRFEHVHAAQASQAAAARREAQTDQAVRSAEDLEVKRLREEVRKMKEQRRVQLLRHQVEALKKQVLAKAEADARDKEEAPEGGAGGGGGQASDGKREQAAQDERVGGGGHGGGEGEFGQGILGKIKADREGKEGDKHKKGYVIGFLQNPELEGAPLEHKHQYNKGHVIGFLRDQEYEHGAKGVGGGEGLKEAEEEVKKGKEEEREGERRMKEEKERQVHRGKEEEEEGARKVREGEEEERIGKETAEAKPLGGVDHNNAIKVCDGVGCHYVEVAQPPPPPHRLSRRAYARSAFEGGEGLWNILFPWEHSLDSEVHLNGKGEIRADHDDPNGRLMPHNKYQDARYPDGAMHGREAHETRPGITNSVATHLFSDNIVKAAPGFNAGMGRHIRAQQEPDWQRNWEAYRTKNVAGKPIRVG